MFNVSQKTIVYLAFNFCLHWLGVENMKNEEHQQKTNAFFKLTVGLKAKV